MTEPIDQATKERIEKEAIAFADSIEVNSIATHTGLVKGYIAGATVWAERLKQERNKVIDGNERIELFIQTLMHIKNALSIIQKNYDDPYLYADMNKLKNTIEFVIQKNADQINKSHE